MIRDFLLVLVLVLVLVLDRSPRDACPNISVNRATKLYSLTESRTLARPDDPIIDPNSYHSHGRRGHGDTGTQDFIRHMGG